MSPTKYKDNQQICISNFWRSAIFISFIGGLSVLGDLKYYFFPEKEVRSYQ